MRVKKEGKHKERRAGLPNIAFHLSGGPVLFFLSSAPDWTARKR